MPDMQLQPSVLLGWWLSPWELCLVDVFVLPMRLQTPSAPSVLSQTPPLGISCSDEWLTKSMCLCIWKALAGSQETVISGFLHQAFLGIHKNAGVTLYGINHHVVQSLDDLSFSLCSILYLHVSSYEYLAPLLRRTKPPTFWSSFSLSFMWSVNSILGTLRVPWL